MASPGYLPGQLRRETNALRMSIVTKQGDRGTTALMFNRRVAKTHPRLEACGTVDELNAALGLARAHLTDTPVAEQLLAIQQDLIIVMGELATDDADLDRYAAAGFARIGPETTKRLDRLAETLEARLPRFEGWAMPGRNVASAGLDLARTVCRRSERRVCALLQEGELANPEIIVYLNRLADLLWLMARQAEANRSPSSTAPAAKGS